MDVHAPVAYDLSSHHAPGGGPYAFETGYEASYQTQIVDPRLA